MTRGRAPDLVEPLIGFRAWRVGPAGWLSPWTLAAAGPWEPGVTTAVCHVRSFGPATRRRPHRPPAAGCTCGIYALAWPADHRLHGRGDQVVGAIAAWGDIEVHRSGFRAQHAAVVALAAPPPGGPCPTAVRDAARRHDVEVVPRDRLEEAARAFGTPIDPRVVTEPDPRAARSASRRVGQVGIALDEHVWARPGVAHVDTGPTGAFAALLGDRPGPTLPPVGARIEAGDVLAVLTGADGRALLLFSCVTGTVVALSPGMEHGWLVRLADADWATDQQRLVWGRRGATEYAAVLARRAAGHDVFADVLHEHHLHAPAVRNAGDVLRELRRRRELPALSTAADVYAACAPAVHERIAADPAAAGQAARAPVTLRVRTTAPEAELTLVAGDGRVRLHCGGRAGRADITLDVTAETAVRLFAGRLDPARALRDGTLRSDAPAPRTLGALSTLKHVLR